MNKTWTIAGILTLAVVALLCGCSQPKEKALDTAALPGGAKGEETLLDRDFKRLTALVNALGELSVESKKLQTEIAAVERGFFTSEEHDAIEQVLYRYLMCRETLWGLVDFHRDHQAHFKTDSTRTRSFVIGLAAATNLYYYSSAFVHDFLDSPPVIDKLNQADQRYSIPEGTYDQVFKSLTAPEHIKAIRAAGELYRKEMANPGSALSRLAKEEPAYRRHLDEIGVKLTRAQKRVDDILEKSSLLLPNVRNAIRHSEIMLLAQKSLSEAGDALYAIRGLTSLRVARLRKPGAKPVIFTEQQIAELRDLLEPGDIILTFSEGYMSNLFLPGNFKHGITYVGTVAERKELGLAQIAAQVPATERPRVQKALECDSLPDGSGAELIEALAEGVIFNSLDDLLTTRVNRLVVWRPTLTPEQRRDNLGNLFAFLGSSYDFCFDFNDATYQCCTEVIYRCLNQIGSIDLGLTPRMGRQTLSADDLCNYALGSGHESFTCVAFAVPVETGPKDRAKLYTGDEALTQLRKLMMK